MASRRNPYRAKYGVAAFKASCRAIQKARMASPAEAVVSAAEAVRLYRERPSRHLDRQEGVNGDVSAAPRPYWADRDD